MSIVPVYSEIKHVLKYVHIMMRTLLICIDVFHHIGDGTVQYPAKLIYSVGTDAVSLLDRIIGSF